MDRINKTGKLLIDYKREYMKHYSPIVDLSLQTCVDNLVTKNVCDEKIKELILDDAFSLKNFETEVMSHREFLKSMKELVEEFDKLRAIVNTALVKQGFTRFVETENNVDNDCITIIKQYSITPEFIKIYFGLTDDEMPAVMKKRGFAEKFAVLRLSKIFKEIVSEIKPETSEFAQGFSKVYYNQSVDGFSVDYRYHINVNTISEESITGIISKVHNIDKVVEKKFNIKTGIKFYNLQSIELKKDFIPSQPPRNKGKEEIVDSKELDEIQTQLIQSKEVFKDEDEYTKFIDTSVKEKEVKPLEKETPAKEVKKAEKKEKVKSEINPLEIKEDDESPFDDIAEDKITIDDKEIDETAVYEEEANNIKVEIDNSNDFLDGFIPQQVFSMGNDGDDEPGDDDFGTMKAPDEEDIDFT